MGKNKYSSDMNTKQKIEEILLNDFGCFDEYTVDKLLNLFSVSGIISDIEKLPRFDDNAWEEGGNTTREYDKEGGCVDADELYKILNNYR